MIKDKGGWSWTVFGWLHVWKWGFGFGELSERLELQVNTPSCWLVWRAMWRKPQ